MLSTVRRIGSFNWFMNETKLHQEESSLVFCLVFCYNNCTLTYMFTVMDFLCITPHKSIYSMAFYIYLKLLAHSGACVCVCLFKSEVVFQD